MDLLVVDLDECEEAARGADALVVIDVLRACTTAAAALAGGARAVVAVGTVDEARRVAADLGDAVLAGEVGGLPIDGFDLPNSPHAVARARLDGRTVVHRTTAGTQGLVRGLAAPMLLAAAFVNASATAAYLVRREPATVTLVVTGSDSGDRGEEDRALADYLAARLRGESPDPTPFLARMRSSAAAAKFSPGGHLAAYAADVGCAATLDAYDFAMRAAPGPAGYPTLRVAAVR